jgi:predicted acylesterase/phospholipase RssA
VPLDNHLSEGAMMANATFPPPGSPGVFDLGLCFAGAVSAGAYSAGVIDFLIKALDEWEARRFDSNGRPNPDVPQHRVAIRAMSGASAGSVCAAVTMLMFQRERMTGHSPLYETWVRQLDMADLLDTADLDGVRLLPLSALNPAPLQRARDTIGRMIGGQRTRPLPGYVSPWLRTYLTLTNVQGLEYPLALGGATPYVARRHADYVAFGYRGANGPLGDDKGHAVPVEPVPGPAEAVASAWGPFFDAALASAAFPGAFPPRPVTVTQPTDHYGHRTIQQRVHSDDEQFGRYQLAVPPIRFDREPYSFDAIDGGVFNNEPFDLVYSKLLRSRFQRLEPTGSAATGAVLLVDPFPESPEAGSIRPGASFVDVLLQLLLMLNNQGRFRVEDLELAVDGRVFNRFVIAPTRDASVFDSKAMASGALGGFAGFLKEAFRHHDYQLGRRNCQAFLRDWFKLPRGNTHIFGPNPGNNPDELLPVIPLVGDVVKAEIPLPTWDRMGPVELGQLEAALTKRVDGLGDIALTKGATISGAVAAAINNPLSAQIGGWLTQAIRDGLLAHDLLDEAGAG